MKGRRLQIKGGTFMEVKNSDMVGGSLQISTDVIAKISRLAALEIDGVKAVSCGNSPVKGMFAKVSIQRPVTVELTDEVAEITVDVVVRYGYRIPSGQRGPAEERESVGAEHDRHHGLQGQRCGHRASRCSPPTRMRRKKIEPQKIAARRLFFVSPALRAICRGRGRPSFGSPAPAGGQICAKGVSDEKTYSQRERFCRRV